MFKSIQSSLIVIVISVVILSSLTVLAVALNESESSYTVVAKKGALGVTRSIAKTLNKVEASESQLSDVMAYFELYPNVVMAELKTADRTVLASYKSKFPVADLSLAAQSIEELPNEPPLGSFETHNELLTTTLVTLQSGQTAYLVVISDISSQIFSNREELLTTLAPLVLLVMMVSLFITVWLINRITWPVIQLTDFTKRVRDENNYKLRATPTGTQEVITLKRNINAMMDTISEELDKNQATTDQLIEQQKLMSKLANFDSLTGLPNRQFVLDNLRLELSRAKRSKQEISLLFFDLDGFKNVNDSLGHETGDSLLIAVSERVKTVLREGDLFARLGGDEFLIVPDKEAHSVASPVMLAERLLKAMEAPVILDDIELQMSVSIGIANASDVDFDLSQLVGNADIAMYRSKTDGRGTYTVFTDDMNEGTKRRLEIANSILNGLERDEFKAFYQPRVDQRGTIVGYEALIRWEHPTFGNISPVEFISIAEHSGKIRKITAWMVKQVCKELAQIQAMKSADIRVSINLSAHDLHDKGLYQYLVDTIKEYKVSPKNLEFEVTESAFLESFKVSNQFINKVHQLGCLIALDDFGTGYSSLSYLTQMSVDTLKIDREFVKELDSSTQSRLVTQSIIDLAKRLKLSVCAEGVENQFQQDYLAENQCNQFQGFYYDKPAPLSKLADAPKDYRSHFEKV
ncbi:MULTISPECIES: EAL domain-containing protein [Alteromonadaceae]|jgi:diguanylate cyclase (GGDEF)-like protein|uniref:EAL domain-containing protein n=1 Tax=Brumicola blandensis TaxID=3075611 RepID=A0AAW8QYQ0_9ALTE|nr:MULTISPECIES: EAL domain-containing protein [unclassified Alteromonas]MDT0581005.1 EAL domain-containing protein [Alteromonas sp. W409]MDT0629567.1 EAL domain-containing protein [Alteromonas sp. W364]